MADITAYLPVSPTRAINAIANPFFHQVTDGTTGAAVTGAAADAGSNTINALKTASHLLGFNGTTWDRLRSTTANGLVVDVSRVQGTVTVSGTVDTELPTAAALADDTANPTAPAVGAHILGFDGTTWDRIRSLAGNADAVTPPTLGLLGTAAFNYAFDGTNWDRIRSLGNGVVVVQPTDSANAALFTTAAAMADATANPTVGRIGVHLMGFNGTTWDRLTSTTANGLDVDVTRVQGTVTVDSELPAAAALADGAANPTTPTVGAALLGFNGTTWDRVRVSATGRVLVDLATVSVTAVPVSANGTANSSTNPIFVQVTNSVSGSEVQDYNTVASVASGATSNHDYASVGTTFLLKAVHATASGALKVEVQAGPVATLVTKAVGFTSMANPNFDITFDPPIEVPTTGTGTTRLIRTNRELVAMDVYSTIIGMQA